MARDLTAQADGDVKVWERCSSRPKRSKSLYAAAHSASASRFATETEFNGIGELPIYIRIVPVRGTFRTGERIPMQEIAAITAVGGAVIALVAACSLWVLRGRK